MLNVVEEGGSDYHVKIAVNVLPRCEGTWFMFIGRGADPCSAYKEIEYILERKKERDRDSHG